jgi:hypothetical protein
MPDNYKPESGRKTKGLQNMASNKSPTRQTTIQQNSERTENLLHTLKNEGIQDYLQGLTPTDATDYSLWKATRKIKQPQHQIPPIRINRNT